MNGLGAQGFRKQAWGKGATLNKQDIPEPQTTTERYCTVTDLHPIINFQQT